MTATNTAPPGTAAAAPAGSAAAAGQSTQPADELEPRDWAGIALDVAGVAAAAVLVVIIVDVWTEGKLSGWWRARRARGAAPVQE